MTKLTERQKRFCDYYIETGNASEAAKRAGYKSKNLNNIGSENLAKPYIKKYIDDKMKKKDKKRIADQDEILEFLTSVVRGEITEEKVVDKDTKDFKTSPKDRIKAAELLGKRYGLADTIDDKLENVVDSLSNIADLINNQ